VENESYFKNASRGAKAWTSPPVKTWSHFESGQHISCHPPVSIAFDRKPVIQSEQIFGSWLHFRVGDREGASSSGSSHWQIKQVKNWCFFHNFWYLGIVNSTRLFGYEVTVHALRYLLPKNVFIINLTFHHSHGNIEKGLATVNKTFLLPPGNIQHNIPITNVANTRSNLGPVLPRMPPSTARCVPQEIWVIVTRSLCFPANIAIKAPPHPSMETKVDFPTEGPVVEFWSRRSGLCDEHHAGVSRKVLHRTRIFENSYVPLRFRAPGCCG